jgi:hypothetical protein
MDITLQLDSSIALNAYPQHRNFQFKKRIINAEYHYRTIGGVRKLNQSQGECSNQIFIYRGYISIIMPSYASRISACRELETSSSSVLTSFSSGGLICTAITCGR